MSSDTRTKLNEHIHRIMFEDRGVILEALQKGIDKAMIQHKQAGLPVVIERDGKIVWVMPEDLGY
jgi:hypothetical protein